MTTLKGFAHCLAIVALAVALHSTGARANPVVEWNLTALQVAVADGVTSGAAHAQALAAMHLAMHDALNSIDRRYEPYAVRAEPVPAATSEAALAAAAHGVLRSLFPSKSALLEQAYQSALLNIPEGASKKAGIQLGEQVARQIALRRAGTDLRGNPPYDWKAAAPGVFQPVPPKFSKTAALTGVAQAMPFALRSAAQFRAPGPPAPASSEFRRDLAEAKAIGGAVSPIRTDDQTAAAYFWEESSSTQAWNRIARALAAEKKVDLWDSARLFALLNMAVADTAIVIFESKYHYHFWRPVTAIAQGVADADPPVPADAAWSPLLATPVHPEYPSGHAGYCAAAAAILASGFGDDTPFKASSPSSRPPGAVRSYVRFSQAAKECADSRIYAGIHFQTACEHAAAQGRQVAVWVTQGFLKRVSLQ